jgi:hypothetical protein
MLVRLYPLWSLTVAEYCRSRSARCVRVHAVPTARPVHHGPHGSIVTAPLAVYPFPSRQRRHGSIFSRSVRDLMQHLAATAHVEPFLQVSTQRGNVTRQSLPGDTAWSDILCNIDEVNADLIIFLKPVADAAEVVSGAAHPCGHDQPCPELHESEPVIGHLGDCCDSDDDEREATRLLHNAADSSSRPPCNGLEVSYYGLVAQSRSRASSDGCYLIKTVRHADDPTCSCMHYSLMHVCQGVPLSDQAINYWR